MAWMNSQEMQGTAAGAGVGAATGTGPIGAGVGAGVGWLVSGGGQQLWDSVSGGAQGAANSLTGTLSPDQVNSYLSGVQAPSPVQIAGMPEYQNAMQNLYANYGNTGQAASNAYAPYNTQFAQNGMQAGQLGQQYGQQMQGIGQQQAGLYGQIPQGPNLQAATAQPMGQLGALQGYQQQIAMGQAPSAADQMLQNQMANLGRQTQSGIVSAGGMNPALALRSLFQNQSSQGAQLGAAGAQQKLQEQAQFGQMAGQNAQALYGQNFNNAQQGFQNQNTSYGNQMNNLSQQSATAQASQQGQQAALAQVQNAVAQQRATTQLQYNARMSALSAQQDVSNKMFTANTAQANFNQDYQQNVQAYQRFIASMKIQAAQDQARGNAAAWQAGLNGLSQAGTAALNAGMRGGGGSAPGVSPDQAQAADAAGAGTYNPATGTGGDMGASGSSSGGYTPSLDPYAGD